MIYKLILTPEAEKHLHEWRRSGQKKTLKKIAALLEELTLHPTTGTGKVEQLKGNLSNLWSRRIDHGSRMIYRIEDERIIVTVISLRGHYGDK
ncbi:MAG: Txe/YoeB family addiction module toxin [Muribaculaceae bacterium]|nr:Txe/YoeB family addiction module toxin [Muribaculaceae bacterium]